MKDAWFVRYVVDGIGLTQLQNRLENATSGYSFMYLSFGFSLILLNIISILIILCKFRVLVIQSSKTHNLTITHDDIDLC